MRGLFYNLIKETIKIFIKAFTEWSGRPPIILIIGLYKKRRDRVTTIISNGRVFKRPNYNKM